DLAPLPDPGKRRLEGKRDEDPQRQRLAALPARLPPLICVIEGELPEPVEALPLLADEQRPRVFRTDPIRPDLLRPPREERRGRRLPGALRGLRARSPGHQTEQ